MGIGFAIPINMAKGVKDQLIATGKVTRGQLGVIIRDLSPDLAKSFEYDSTDGALVDDVIKDSPAQKAGLKPGDIITKLNGQKVEDIAPFRNTVSMMAPGTKVKLTIVRDGKEIKIPVTIGEMSDSLTTASNSAAAEKLGIEVQNLSPELARQYDYEPGYGVIISQVTQDSPADQVGIQPGMLILSINRRPINSVKQFDQAMKKAAKNNQILLRIQDEQYSRFLLIPLE